MLLAGPAVINVNLRERPWAIGENQDETGRSFDPLSTRLQPMITRLTDYRRPSKLTTTFI